mgnify:CR=1 FL=1
MVRLREQRAAVREAMVKVEVNGAGRHPIYQQLTTVADGSGAPKRKGTTIRFITA